MSKRGQNRRIFNGIWLPVQRTRAVVALGFGALAVALPAATWAQALRTDPAQALQAVEQAAGAPLRVTRSRFTGLVTFLATAPNHPVPLLLKPAAPAGDRALAFMNMGGAAFGIQAAAQVRVTATSAPDEVGMEHVRLQQVYNEIPVRGAELLIHLRGATVVAANGATLADVTSVDTTPRVSAAQASVAAQELLTTKLQVPSATLSEPALEILNPGFLLGTPSVTRLVWFVEAKAFAVREFIWVDAREGTILLHFSQLTEGRNRLVYTAKHTDSLPGTLLRSEGGRRVSLHDANAAYDFSGDTYDYYASQHGRDSYDNAGAALISTVRYCPWYVCPYANAFWDGTQMVYGDGFAAADDVDAHELTHAVTEHSAQLIYCLESGALNESYSDIFGETVDLTNGAGTDTPDVRWLLGEDLPGIGAIRNLADPNAFGQPARINDPDYACYSSCDSSNDNGGVHTNSGVSNHAYALLVDGGTYNGFTVTGIGLTKAAKIEYRALTQYLTSTASFLDNYNALTQSCIDLVGTAGITAADCTEVTNALDAVEMSHFTCTLRCGNGALDPAEQCDDGNLIDGDGCDSNCTPTGCGNRIVSAGEQCDDGNLADGDGCDSNCTLTACGNGILTAGEQCDDGNASPGDGCDASCAPETGWTCPVVGQPCRPICGDGLIVGGEQCEDGNLVDGDGCDSNCTLTGCGNGIVTAGEACDDGNDIETDTCKNDCTLNVCGDGVVRSVTITNSSFEDTPDLRGWTVVSGPHAGTVTVDRTGGGTDGQAFASLSFTADCSGGYGCTEYGPVLRSAVFTVAAGTTVSADWRAFNGDDWWAARAVLKDASTNATVATLFAATGSGASTSWATATATVPAGGTYFLEFQVGSFDSSHGGAIGARLDLDNIGPAGEAEACDDGNLIDGDGCDSNCTPTGCGNGIATAGEQCDDGNGTDGDGCDSNCTLTACGNGIVTAGEQCDDGNDIVTDGCKNDCTLNVCGDGARRAGSPSISNRSFEEVPDLQGWTVVAGPHPGTVTVNRAGDPTQGVAFVSLSFASYCSGAIGCTGYGPILRSVAFGASAGTIVSADWRASNGEDWWAARGVLKDASTNATVATLFDATSSGANSSWATATATVPAGGTYVLEFQVGSFDRSFNAGIGARLDVDNIGPVDEACDDGNLTDGDGCDSNCTPTGCGNRIVTAGEQCDDGNDIDTDPCKNDCTINVCGDGVPGGGLVSNFSFEDVPNLRSWTVVSGPHAGGVVVNRTGDGTDGQAFASLSFSADCSGAVGCTEYGPVLQSAAFGAQAGARISADWRAINGSDIWAARGVLKDNATKAIVATLFDATGSGANTSWTTATVTIPAAGVYFVEFQVGSFDSSFGGSIGARLDLDKIGPHEECDDGNLIDGDGCDANCTVSCGNGMLTPGEQCDDGNVNTDDGCDASCRTEVGWTCPAAGQPCEREHYQCYTGMVIVPQLPIAPVTLVDALTSFTAKVGALRHLCTPTNKYDEDPAALSDPNHLESYSIVPTEPRRLREVLPLRNQTVVNQFGTVAVDVLWPRSLLVPTAKDLASNPPAPVPPTIDHFTCYTVRRSQGALAFVPVPGVTLEDQFGPGTVTVGRPTRLCVPANKNNETPGAETHPGSLLCHRIMGGFKPIGSVFTTNQFGPAQFYPRFRNELCVPSVMNP